jgi:hypothetical protein
MERIRAVNSGEWREKKFEERSGSLAALGIEINSWRRCSEKRRLAAALQTKARCTISSGAKEEKRAA